MVRNKVMCAIFFGGYDYYSFQNPRASKDDFFLNALKTLLRQSRVIKSRRICMRKTILATPSPLSGFHTNPCKFRIYSYWCKIFPLTLRGSNFLAFITKNLNPKCIKERFNVSLKFSKFTRTCTENHSSKTGWQE